MAPAEHLTIPLVEFDHLFEQYKRLRDENEQLRAALGRIAALGDSAAKLAYIDEHDARIAINVAREALA